jgi:molybdenum cofactor sulfurtransferase
MKIVSEYFPWSPGKTANSSSNSNSSSSSGSSQFVYTQANHKSVLGMGAYAKQAGAQLRCLSRDQMQHWLDTPNTTATATCCSDDQGASNANSSSSGDGVTLHLVAYPVKDNYEGQLYPTDWVQQVHDKSDAANQYLVMLDAAAYVPTHSLDLSQVGSDVGSSNAVRFMESKSGRGSCSIAQQQHNMCLLPAWPYHG